MAGVTALKQLKTQLDGCRSKADYDALSAHLSKLIHDEELRNDPRRAAKELDEQRKQEAQHLVDRMKAALDDLKKERNGKYKDYDQLMLRKAIERAEENLSMAETALAKLG